MHQTSLSTSRSDANDARAHVFSEAPKWGGIGICAVHWARLTVLSACCFGVTACSTTGDSPGVLDRTLQAVGLQRPAPPIPVPEGVSDRMPGSAVGGVRKIALRLHAGDVLNTDANGRSLSVVARIYKLRDKVTFESAPYADFQDLRPSKPTEFAADIVDVKEVVLTPGKRYDVMESLGGDARYFAVVALFRAPAQQRWRFVFDSKAAAGSGVTLGVHACALSVSAGQPLDVAPEMLRVAGVQCSSP